MQFPPRIPPSAKTTKKRRHGPSRACKLPTSELAPGAGWAPRKTKRSRKSLAPNLRKRCAAASYLATQLFGTECVRYRAAGILYIRRTGADSFVLMGSEHRTRGRDLKPPNPFMQPFLNCLGGRREKTIDKSPLDTAMREFWEESGCLLQKSEFLSLRASLDRGAPVLWDEDSSYALFVHVTKVDGTPSSIHTLPQRYNQVPLDMRPPGAEMSALHWVSVRHLCASLQLRRDSRDEGGRHADALVQDTQGTVLRLYPFATSLLSHPALQDFLTTLYPNPPTVKS